MECTSRVTICDVPNEVLLSIFSFLRIPDLARCAGTCKHWHALVTGFTHLWKGKYYRSYRSPRECAETHAILYALPPFQEVTVEPVNGYMVHVSYPHLVLSAKYVRVMKDFPRVRSEYLSTREDIAGDILFYRSTIDFERLRHLQLLRKPTFSIWARHIHSANYVVRTALNLCPKLRRLSLCARYVSADYLDTVKELGQLESLEMECPSLQKLTFLRHCSGALDELQLVACTGLPSRELTQLRRLRKLRRLRLSGCRFEQDHLAAAVGGLCRLESLQVDCCSPVRDLSVLRPCGRLWQLHLFCSSLPERIVTLTPGWRQLLLRSLRLPTDADDRSARVVGVSVIAEDLPAALARLEQQGLTGSCLAYLSGLHHCSRLRHLCCDFVCEHDKQELSNVRIHVTLTRSRY